MAGIGKQVGFRSGVGERKKADVVVEGYEPFTISYEVPSVVDLAEYGMDAETNGHGEALAKFVGRALRSWSLSPEPPDNVFGRIELLKSLDSVAVFTAIATVIMKAAEGERKN